MINALTLWAPGLLNSLRVKEAQQALQELKLPALQNLIAKSDHFPVKKQNFFQQASFLFHQAETMPVAATNAAIDIEDANLSEFWLRVDPVQLIPDRDSLVLVAAKHLGIEEAESKALLQSFNEHFKQDGVELIWGATDAWYLSIKQPVDIQTTNLELVDNNPVNEFYPQGNAAQYWRQLINETQMLFYTHPVNEARREKGWPEINSVWVWGEGLLKPENITQRKDAVIWSENTYLQGLAKQTMAESQRSPSNYAEWYGSQTVMTDHNKHLIMLDDFFTGLENLQLEEWIELLKQLEENWFMPILEALKDKQINSLLIDLGCDYRCHIKPADLRRFWRFRKGLDRV